MAQQAPPPDGKSQHLYKVIVTGEYAVGKTSMIRRYVEGVFTPNYKLTIGVDFALKVLEWDENNVINLQLWDIAGHERYGACTSAYYKYAVAGLIVFDLSRPSTLEAVKKWRDDINSKVCLPNEQPIPLLLIANKSDLPNVVVDKQKLDRFCEQEGFFGWFETSAQNNTNIDVAMRAIVEKILQVTKEAAAVPGPVPGTVRVDTSRSGPAAKPASTCCDF